MGYTFGHPLEIAGNDAGAVGEVKEAAIGGEVVFEPTKESTAQVFEVFIGSPLRVYQCAFSGLKSFMGRCRRGRGMVIDQKPTSGSKGGGGFCGAGAGAWIAGG